VIQKPTAPAHIRAQGAANAANAWLTTAGTAKCPAASSHRQAKRHMTDP